MDDDDDRLAALEARIAALEAAIATAPPPPPAPALDPDAFWALEGLHARTGGAGAVMIVGEVVVPGGTEARWQEGVGADELLAEDWGRAADLLAALGHPVRLALLRHVLHGQATARELQAIDGMGTSGQVYHHLRHLTATGWLRSLRGRYEVPPERVVPLLAAVLGGRR